MEYLKNLIKYFYQKRYVLTYIAIAALVASAFFYRLGTLTPGLNNVEIKYFDFARNINLGNLLDSVVFLPHAALTRLIGLVLEPTPLSLRLGSVLFAATMVPMIYYVLYIWHTRRIATLGVILLLGSSWFVGLARLGTADIMYAWGIMAAVTAMTMVFHHQKHSRRRLILMAIAGLLIGLSLYVPYVPFAFLLAGLIAWHSFKRVTEELSGGELLVLVATVAITIAPLIGGLIVEPRTSLVLLGLPDSVLPTSFSTVLEHMTDLFAHIFWQSDGSLTTNVGNLPLLGIFGAALAALGIYHYEQHRQNIRTHIIVGLFFGMFLLLSIDYQPEKTAALLPLVYILIAMGALTLLTQWYRIFPKNPLARTVGWFVFALFVVISLSYHNQRYFAAWARSPETKVAFSNDVLLVEDSVRRLAEIHSLDSTLILVNPPEDRRLEMWLNITLNPPIMTDIYSTNAALSPTEILLVGPAYNVSQTAVNLNKYSLEDQVETTSLVDPVIYSLYVEKQGN